MGVEFKLSDRELPVSPAFIRFLDGPLSGTGREPEVWPDQLGEELVGGDAVQHELAANAAERVMSCPAGRESVARAYELLVALLTGDLRPLKEVQSRFHFINVVGIPRTGGTYLTAELYRSIGIPPHTVPHALAHDGFPEAGPFELSPGSNGWITTLKTAAEYLTMVELFFSAGTRRNGRIVVPKKLTQLAYAAGFFQQLFGSDMDCILTVRHPVAACISTYEKSGGLPADRAFIVRSNIEAWCRRDLLQAGCTAERLASLEYFDAYLLYWEQYHLLVATTGLARSSPLCILPYGAASMQSLARRYHEAHGSGLEPANFAVGAVAHRRHPDWLERAEPVITRVSTVWRDLGLTFPASDIEDCA
jgi:hypothetical protein